MKTIVIDSDILINFLRGREKVRKFLLSHVKEAIISCSAITVAEICAGMRDHEREKTMELIDSLHIIDINRTIAEKAGEYKRNEKNRNWNLTTVLLLHRHLCTKLFLPPEMANTIL